jgi:CheY-like chemotaxis protein/anti-sigma regulatory factor (Ser/Thr protein kinase)
MSHELRTPMNAILGFAQLLDGDPATPERPRRHVGEILRAGEHLLGLIDDLLDLARIEAGKHSVELQPVPVDDLVGECLRLVEPAARARRIVLNTGARAGDGTQVLADRGRLRQVLFNLLSNAIKYNRDAGLIEIACSADEGWVRVSVTDTGPGLSDEEQQRLFQDFERLGADRSGIKGAGIGLALSRRLVDMMQGEIGVSSQPGLGSTFWVRLARADGQASAATHAALAQPLRLAEAAPTAGTAVRSVLYIEDDPVNLLLIEAALERLPQWRLTTATRPEEGLDLAEAERPNLILLDIQLPGIDGYEVLRRLRASPSTCGIPVIAVSANAMAGDQERGAAAGFAAYVTKPVDLARLPEVMERAVAGVGAR